MQLRPMIDGIARSEVFVALVTRAWLKDPRCQAQLERAVSLGKPILLLVEDGLPVPAHIRGVATAVRAFRRDDLHSALTAITEFVAST